MFRRTLRLGLLLWVLSITTAVFAQSVAPPGRIDPGISAGTSDPVRRAGLLVAGSRFKLVAVDGYRRALFEFASAAGVERFRQIDAASWPAGDPQLGWSFFLGTSVQAVAAPEPGGGLIAYYNPWSDVVLLTEWTWEDGLPWIGDAELLMGDWVRQADTALSPVPLWLRGQDFRPLTLGTSVARTVAAFEQVFGTAGLPWRDRLPILRDRQLLRELNAPAVALMLLNAWTDIARFRTAEANAPLLRDCRTATFDSVRSAVQGHVDRLLAHAPGTLPETRDVLRRVAPEWFNHIEAAAAVTGKDGCLVFLTPAYDASGALGLLFETRSGRPELTRIDIVDYQRFYLRGAAGTSSAAGAAPP